MEIIFSIVGKIGEYLVGPIGEQFGYMISYKTSIANLEEKIPKLLEKKEAVQQSVDRAQWNRQAGASEVKTWLTNVGKKLKKMCLNRWYPNMKLRYSLSKKAQKNTQAINDLLREGEKYDRVYNIETPLEVRSTSTERFKDFELRKSIIGNVLEALRDKKIDTIALCGMGGIGKTEMAKEIARRVKAESLFNKVIQDELAEMLGKRLDEKSLPERANELYSRLTENKNVLAIGVYNAIKEKSCKILLTSRNEETCIGMKIQKIFPIGLLSKKEAWNFFIEMVGDCIETPDLISIVKQVVKECARLTLAIVTVRGVLSNKSDKNEWKAALQQLKMSSPEIVYGMHPKVYSSIEFSYNYLKSDKAKSCFLLCCLYPEDYDVPVEHLVRYGVAKRNKSNVHAIVKNLRRSNLLLDSNEDKCVKMHDIVRDVSISIASRDENGFMVALDRGLEEWRHRRIDMTHPTELKCTKIQLLRLSCLNKSETFPGNLFNEMKEMKILSLQEGCFSLTSLPPSIQILQNLKMLNLESCHLGDVSAIGTLRNLEILGFCNSYIKELPSEIGNLSRLKLLDMKECGSLERIAASVLSSLSRLEELYVGKFRNWACKTTMEGNGEVTNDNASLAELIPYSNQLVVLEISVPSILCLPKELHFSNSNFRFKIKIGTVEKGGSTTSTVVAHKLFSSNTILWVPNLKFLHVEDCGSLEVVFDLEGLKIEENGKPFLAVLSYLNLWNLSGMAHMWKNIPPGFQGFQNLVSINIQECHSLKILLPASIAKLLVQLQLIVIRDCNLMENIIQMEYEAREERGAHSLEWPSIKKIKLLECPKLKIFGSEVKSGRNERKMDAELDPRGQDPIYIRNCDSLEVIFELEGLNAEECNIVNNLINLSLMSLPKLLHIWKKGPQDIKGFNYLRWLHWRPLLLLNLPKLECFYTEDNHDFKWPSLERITIAGCPNLKMFVSTSTKTPKLKGVNMEPKAMVEAFQPMVEGDLNATIQHTIKEKVRYNL
ncbi:hypothetical protein I3760_16G056900 [Carya illinoinensis]|nr:hypothetical protein I3760_16G056900 [Carya illinoinensis]